MVDQTQAAVLVDAADPTTVDKLNALLAKGWKVRASDVLQNAVLVLLEWPSGDPPPA
jgi:hypothetical protein